MTRDAPVRIDAVLVGQPALLRGPELSAIRKTPVDGRVAVTRLGLDGDAQADLSVHGGPDKAVHHYAFAHYAMWRAAAPDPELLAQPGAFGENISTAAMTEESVCIGDRFQMGSAVVEVSQPRQPCWKQAHVLGWPLLPKLMAQAAKSGWYYRVVQEGAVQAGDAMTLLERPHADWPVARVLRMVMHRSAAPDVAALRALAALEVLEDDWRAMAGQLAS